MGGMGVSRAMGGGGGGVNETVLASFSGRPFDLADLAARSLSARSLQGGGANFGTPARGVSDNETPGVGMGVGGQSMMRSTVEAREAMGNDDDSDDYVDDDSSGEEDGEERGAEGGRVRGGWGGGGGGKEGVILRRVRDACGLGPCVDGVSRMVARKGGHGAIITHGAANPRT